MNNSILKRNKPVAHQSSVKTIANKDAPNISGPFSKCELLLDKDIVEKKTDQDRIFIVMKIKKPFWKNKKSKRKFEFLDIKFDYNLKVDTVEKVVNEMKNQRQLNLNEEETIYIMDELNAYCKIYFDH